MAEDEVELGAEPAVEATPAPVASEPELPPAPPVDTIGDAIKAWVAAHIHNSPVSKATEAYNHLISVLPHLAAKLKEG